MKARLTSFRSRGRQRGATMVEFAIAGPIAILVIMALVQLGLAMVAKQVIDDATFEGARLGASEHAQKTEVLRGIERKLLPLYQNAYQSNDTVRLAEALVAEQLDLQTPTTLTVTRLNPTDADFSDFGMSEDNGSGGTVTGIPNDNLEFRTYAGYKGPDSKQTIQDANVLRVKVTYALQLKVPLMKLVFGSVMCGIDSGVNAFGRSDGGGIASEQTDGDCVTYWRQGRMPITSYATVQMQSDAWKDTSW